MIKKGLFITFEGGEGAGKSTQCKLLNESFIKTSYEVLLTREPGGTKEAEEIRELLVKGETNKWLPQTETLLHMASRSQHVGNLIKPSLEQGTNVICDRFIDSTIAYQSHGHGLDYDLIISLHEKIFGDFYPDLTIILDVTTNDGLDRTKLRGDDENRYENMGESFHQRVTEGFKQIAAKNEGRCILINANDTIENIHYQIVNQINDRFSLALTPVE